MATDSHALAFQKSVLGTANMLKVFNADLLVLLHTSVLASLGLGLAGVPKD